MSAHQVTIKALRIYDGLAVIEDTTLSDDQITPVLLRQFEVIDPTQDNGELLSDACYWGTALDQGDLWVVIGGKLYRGQIVNRVADEYVQLHNLSMATLRELPQLFVAVWAPYDHAALSHRAGTGPARKLAATKGEP